MLNFLKNRNKTEAEPIIEKEPVEQLETETEIELEDSEPIDVRLEALTNYFEECEKNGIEMSREMVETEIRDRLGLEIDELLGKEITDPEIKMTHEEIISEINKIMEQKAEVKGTPLSYLRDKVFKSKFAKAAFVSAMLLLKFNPAQAGNHEKVVVKDKIEHDVKKPVSLDGGDDHKTFKASAEDFQSPDGTIIISATNNFETDKADLQDAKKLGEKFDNFLSSINQNNFESLMAQDWVVKGSSDERHTNWQGGNEGLTQARISAVKNIIISILSHHDFSQQLKPDQIKQILEKEINELYPETGAEKGVTYLTDLVNPSTGDNFTDAEIKNIKDNNPSEYHKMLDKCRYTDFTLSAVEKRVVEKMEPIKGHIELLKIKDIDNKPLEIPDPEKNKIFSVKYDNYYLLVDESPSMEKTKKNMAKELSDLKIEKPFMVANYSNKLTGVKYEKNSTAAAKKMMRMNTEHSSSLELSLSSAISLLEKVEAGRMDSGDEKVKSGEQLPKGVLYIATDETLQDVNQIKKLKEISERNNVDVKFLIFYVQGSKVLKLTLDEVQKQIDLNNIIKRPGGRLAIKKIVDAEGKTVVYDIQ